MTTDRAKKIAVRLRKAETGESYMEALRQIEAEQAFENHSYVIFHQCANCDAELHMTIRGLFCSDFCKDLAGFVRYARRVTRDASKQSDPEVQYALKIQMAHLLSGGYAERDRRLTKQQRAAVIEADNGKCRKCGKPGTEIDHIAGSSCDPRNLQLLCHECHKEKTTAMLQPASPEHVAWVRELFE